MWNLLHLLQIITSKKEISQQICSYFYLLFIVFFIELLRNPEKKSICKLSIIMTKFEKVSANKARLVLLNGSKKGCVDVRRIKRGF